MKASSERSALARWSWGVAKLAVFALATWYLAMPQLPLAWNALQDLAGVRPLMIALGAAFSLASLMAYSQLTRVLLGNDARPGHWHMLGIVTTSLGINRVMPAGAAAGSIMTFRLLERAGVSKRQATFVMATQSIGSAVVLNALLWVGLAAAIPLHGLAPSHLLALGVGSVVFALTAATIDALLHQRRWLWRAVSALMSPFPALTDDKINDFLSDQSERIIYLKEHPKVVRRAGIWAIANWLLDATALWIFLAAFDVNVDPVVVLVAFAMANVVAVLPLTPGGLGVTELALVAVLTHFGAPPVQTALGVAAYRVFNYWVPIPGSALSYLSVRHLTPNRADPPATDLATAN